jgi:hypothetical protein
LGIFSPVAPARANRQRRPPEGRINALPVAPPAAPPTIGNNVVAALVRRAGKLLVDEIADEMQGQDQDDWRDI